MGAQTENDRLVQIIKIALLYKLIICKFNKQGVGARELTDNKYIQNKRTNTPYRMVSLAQPRLTLDCFLDKVHTTAKQAGKNQTE